MSRGLKIFLWAGLLITTLLLGYFFSRAHGEVMAESPGASASRMVALLALFVLAAVGFALVTAYGVSSLVGERAEKWFLLGGEPEEEEEEEDGDVADEAEQLRMNGDPLEAIRLLRAHLEKHPDELKLMARIAEMYKDELNNPLAAALEYEELLRRNPPAEQWGWAALHLAKLYDRLNQRERALELLGRLQAQYGHTVAARRARRVMGEADKPGSQAEAETEAGENPNP